MLWLASRELASRACEPGAAAAADRCRQTAAAACQQSKSCCTRSDGDSLAVNPGYTGPAGETALQKGTVLAATLNSNGMGTLGGGRGFGSVLGDFGLQPGQLPQGKLGQGINAENWHTPIPRP